MFTYIFLLKKRLDHYAAERNQIPRQEIHISRSMYELDIKESVRVNEIKMQELIPMNSGEGDPGWAVS